MSVTQSVELKHILFVDDDHYLLEGLRDALRPHRRRWSMSFVTSGEEALALLTEREHDVVISDLRMPGPPTDSVLRARPPTFLSLCRPSHRTSLSTRPINLFRPVLRWPGRIPWKNPPPQSRCG